MTAVPAPLSISHPYLRAATVLARAATGLLAHALAHPFVPASIERRTGKVVAR